MTWRRLPFYITLLFTLIGLCVPAAASSGTYPTALWNGLQISYTISGATVSGSSDKNGEARSNGFSCIRTLTGSLGSGALQVSGTVTGGGVSSDMLVIVSAGDQAKEQRFNIKGGGKQDFSVSVPIPQGASSGSVHISVLGNYTNSGGTTRDVVVKGTFAGAAPPKQDPPKQDPPKQDPSKPEQPKGPLLFPPDAPAGPPTSSGGGTVAPPPKPQGPPAVKTPDKQEKTPEQDAKPPETKGLDWKTTAKYGAMALAIAAIAALLTAVGAWGYVMLAAPDIGLKAVLGPVMMEVSVFLWTAPYLGPVVRAIFGGLEKFTLTSIPTLKLLWGHWGTFSDYLAQSKFWQRHYEQLGNAKFPSNWNYDHGPSGGRKER